MPKEVNRRSLVPSAVCPVWNSICSLYLSAKPPNSPVTVARSNADSSSLYTNMNLRGTGVGSAKKCRMYWRWRSSRRSKSFRRLSVLATRTIDIRASKATSIRVICAALRAERESWKRRLCYMW
jgi:hypothetical protein